MGRKDQEVQPRWLVIVTVLAGVAVIGMEGFWDIPIWPFWLLLSPATLLFGSVTVVVALAGLVWITVDALRAEESEAEATDVESGKESRNPWTE